MPGPSAGHGRGEGRARIGPRLGLEVRLESQFTSEVIWDRTRSASRENLSADPDGFWGRNPGSTPGSVRGETRDRFGLWVVVALASGWSSARASTECWTGLGEGLAHGPDWTLEAHRARTLLRGSVWIPPAFRRPFRAPPECFPPASVPAHHPLSLQGAMGRVCACCLVAAVRQSRGGSAPRTGTFTAGDMPGAPSPWRGSGEGEPVEMPTNKAPEVRGSFEAELSHNVALATFWRRAERWGLSHLDECLSRN